MRTRVALIAVAGLCFAGGDAEAKFRGGGFLKGSSRAATMPARSTAEPRIGVGAVVVVPVSSGRSSAESLRTPQEERRLPLPPRPADEEAPRIHSASASNAAAETKPDGAARHWCTNAEGGRQDGGLCVLGLRPDLRGAPALLAFN
jgi:hypothetical protein